MVFNLVLHQADVVPVMENQDTVDVNDEEFALALMQFFMVQLTLAGDDAELHLDLSCLVWYPTIFIAIVAPRIQAIADRVVKLTLTKTTTRLKR